LFKGDVLLSVPMERFPRSMTQTPRIARANRAIVGIVVVLIMVLNS